MRFRDPRSINLTPLWVLIGVNVLVFIATSISSGSILGVSQQIAAQAGVSSATISSQPWTIVTALFIHDGIYHILFNMLTLYFFGMYVLALVGETRFFLVYFIGGIVGNALFMLFAPNSIAVGASGAIFALGGVLVVLVPRLKVMIFPITNPYGPLDFDSYQFSFTHLFCRCCLAGPPRRVADRYRCRLYF